MTTKTKDLKEAIDQVVFAAALNTTRPVLAGVYFFVDKDELKMVATDSYRLAESAIDPVPAPSQIYLHRVDRHATRGVIDPSAGAWWSTCL